MAPVAQPSSPPSDIKTQSPTIFSGAITIPIRNALPLLLLLLHLLIIGHTTTPTPQCALQLVLGAPGRNGIGMEWAA